MIFSNKLFIPARTIVKPFRPFGLLSLHHNIPRILHPLPRSRREETAHTHCAFYLLVGSDGSKRELVASCRRSKSLLRAQKSLAHNSCSSITRRGYEGFLRPNRPDMGGGNAQKSKMAREKNLEKAKNAAKGSQLETNKKAMTIQCKVCMQTFICTTSEVKCREHAEAKHPKSDVYACFPHLKK